MQESLHSLIGTNTKRVSSQSAWWRISSDSLGCMYRLMADGLSWIFSPFFIVSSRSFLFLSEQDNITIFPDMNKFFALARREAGARTCSSESPSGFYFGHERVKNGWPKPRPCRIFAGHRDWLRPQPAAILIQFPLFIQDIFCDNVICSCNQDELLKIQRCRSLSEASPWSCLKQYNACAVGIKSTQTTAFDVKIPHSDRTSFDPCKICCHSLDQWQRRS